jgi:chromosomal replication initiation ATPase DnaA
MTATIRQLPLPLPPGVAMEAEDFLVTASNSDAVKRLNAWPDWPGEGLVLYGPHACGKSHLAAIWAARSSALRLEGPTLTIDDAVAADRPVVVDDADACANEMALFHLINRTRAKGHGLLLIGVDLPVSWPVTVPDLASRLKALPTVAVHQPDDLLLTGLAAKLFADRQITVSDEVIAYMLQRLERSNTAIASAVGRLDGAALAAKRPITVALARKVLNPEET